MPLVGIPESITPEFLCTLAKMGHGDMLVIADANFPSDTIASGCVVNSPIRVHGITSDLLKDILKLFPLDQYEQFPVKVMDRVDSDKAKGLVVPAYEEISSATNGKELEYVERFSFYELAKKAFAVVQTNDYSLYANVIIMKGVISKTNN
jgi:L-fucose mutarotase